jgi:homoserine/homoserine lactone efflux protein
MSLDLYLAFLTVSVALILLPGPNVALIVANSVAHGWRCGLLTVAGTSTAMLLQLSLTVLSLATVLSVMTGWLDWLRWFGVAYLLYLGVKAWRAPPVETRGPRAEAPAHWSIYVRGFLVSLANPKTLLFFGAFLPQFVSPNAEPAGQLIVLSATFLALATVLDGMWAVTADRFGRLLAINARLRNRLTGGVLVGAGVGLAFAHKS